ncbi:MAG: 4-(cytidine 5'-diphospho)-2-C-methyl-D-erythritol kinase [Pseudomonadales bacterium]|nr:4-(cytidine 5'-diphospho)-2-C-methyl-D-erythritol kinase [Pseudomonadales bacterium]
MAHNSLTLPSPAKLNLFLHITGRRSDGYHELQTAFQLLDFGDTVEIHARSDNKIVLLESLEGVPDEDNIVIRAAKLLQQRQTDKNAVLGADIKINKRIPMGGGLGGGSSNAASTLLGLNYLWQMGLSNEQLAEIGLSLGADVPVFIYGQNSFGEGIGERLQPLVLPKYWFTVIKPPISVPTAEIFSHSQLTRDTVTIKMAAVFKHLQTADIANALRNDCEATVRREYPEISEALDWLNEWGTARLTGTGACIFARFASLAEAEAALAAMPASYTGFIAQGTDRSTAHQALEMIVTRP